MNFNSLQRSPINDIFLKILQIPYDYISSLPCKGFRANFIDAINVWLDLGEDDLQAVKSVVDLLHNSSLM